MTIGHEGLTSALADRYRVERELGQGGMATVYLAHDLKHDRKVAIKVLRPELAAVIGAERFLREIKTIANLQHPHILGLIDSGTAVTGQGSRVEGDASALDSRPSTYVFYVMPYVEGESLRDRLQREKQLPIADAVRLATEVAAALDYAHRHGVIHRDVKPENVLLHDGSALVADFGIALAVSTAGGTRMTETGMSLGTPHYMSPEQAMGEREITARSDVYALGAMTYEMLIGEPPFTGPTAQAIVAKVMTAEPTAPAQLRRSVSPAVNQAILTALEKLPADRWSSAREFSEALTGSPFPESRRLTTAASRGRTRWLRRTNMSGAVLLLALLGLAAWGWFRPRQPAALPAIVSYLPAPEPLEFGGGAQFGALSPDGTRFVFVGFAENGATQLWLWDLATRRPVLLDGTDRAEWPFWSPDGSAIGFFADGWLARIPARGGGQTRLCPVVAPHGGVWSPGGDILFVAGGGLHRGGEPGACGVLVKPDGRAWTRPSALPDGRHFVVTLGGSGPGATQIYILDAKTGSLRRIGTGGMATFVPPSYLLYESYKSNSAAILAQRIDPERGVLLGSPVLVADSIWEPLGDASYTASENGILVVRRGLPDLYDLLVDRSGRVLDTLHQPVTWTHAFARQHDWVALGGQDLWVADLSRRSISSLTPGGSASGLEWSPVWSPRDTAIAYSDNCGISVRRVADGARRELIPSPSVSFTDLCHEPTDWTPDGSELIVTVRAGDSVATHQIWRYRFRDSTYLPLLAGARNNLHGAVSQDGRWLAYASDATGNYEIYVAPYQGGLRGKRVSSQGGFRPRWRADSRELFFYGPKGLVMRASVESQGDLSVGTPEPLFPAPGARADLIVAVPFDASADGQRFVLHPGSARDGEPLVLVANWPKLVGLAP